MTFFPVHLAAVFTCLRASWVLTKSLSHFVQTHLRVAELYSIPSGVGFVGLTSSVSIKGVRTESPIGERLGLYGEGTSTRLISDKSSPKLCLVLVAKMGAEITQYLPQGGGRKGGREESRGREGIYLDVILFREAVERVEGDVGIEYLLQLPVGRDAK